MDNCDLNLKFLYFLYRKTCFAYSTDAMRFVPLSIILGTDWWHLLIRKDRNFLRSFIQPEAGQMTINDRGPTLFYDPTHSPQQQQKTWLYRPPYTSTVPYHPYGHHLNDDNNWSGQHSSYQSTTAGYVFIPLTVPQKPQSSGAHHSRPNRSLRLGTTEWLCPHIHNSINDDEGTICSN